MPSGTSTIPTFWILPESENIFVPLFFSVPSAPHHAAPFRMIIGAFAYDSTLLMLDGCPNAPACAGNGGLIFGIPRRSSSELKSPVSSPQT